MNRLLFDLKIRALDALSRIPPPQGRYLLCRPRGGMNDSLHQVQKCWRYAAVTRRTLIVDAARSGMLDPLANYFEARNGWSTFHLSTDPDLLELLDSIACHPGALTGRIGSYRAVARDSKFYDEESGDLLSFDFGSRNEAPLLVHEQCGGGRGVGFLSQLRLTSEVAAIVRDRMKNLPASYIGIHVRNSDVKTDYRTFFGNISEVMKGKSCLICSDDRRCIQYATEFFRETDIHTVSNVPDTGGERLHENAQLDRREANVDSIADLIALAHASTIIRPERALGYASGFADLAMDLKQRKWILRGLVERGNTVQGDE